MSKRLPYLVSPSHFAPVACAASCLLKSVEKMKSLESASTQKPAATENSPAVLRGLEIAPKQVGDRPDKGGHLRMALVIHCATPV